MSRNKFTKETASQAGKTSKRGRGKLQMLEEAMLRHYEHVKNGGKPLTMEDLKNDSATIWLWLRENAETWDQVLLCEDKLSKYIHTTRIEATGKDGKDLIEKITVEIVEKKSDESKQL